MKNPLYKLKSYLSGQNLVKVCQYSKHGTYQVASGEKPNKDLPYLVSIKSPTKPF